MRYYNIVIAKSDGTVFRQYTSLQTGGMPNPGSPNPAALKVELSIAVVAYGAPDNTAGAFVRVWGVPLADVGQAANFYGMAISVYGGMSKGLPLANPAQAGLLVQGTVWQAFGNWIGTDQTLEFQIIPQNGTPDSPNNITINWKAGQPLAAAAQNTLSAAFPGAPVSININPNLVLGHDQQGYYQTLGQFAAYINKLSASIIGGNYPGVSLSPNQGGFVVYDGSSPGTPKAIVYTDLIGQPTWIDFLTINIKTVLRSDIRVGDFVTLPPTLVTTTAAANSQFYKNLSFQGTFLIQRVQHFGNSRQPDAASWVTVFDAIAQTTASTSRAASDFGVG